MNERGLTECEYLFIEISFLIKTSYICRYRSFLSDRDGVLPTPPDASNVGSRISLG